MKRKFLCAVLSLLMVVSLLPIVVGADETSVLDLAFTQRETAVGATEVRVGVDMSGNPGLVTATIPVKWDNNVLHLKSVTPSTDIIGSGWCGMSMSEYTSNGTYYLAWDNDLASQDYTTTTGCLAELVFTIVDPDVDTSTELKFDLTDERANIMNYSMVDLTETITVTAGAKMVNVTAKEAGGDTPDPEPSEEGDVVFTFGDVNAKPGDKISVEIVMKGNASFNSIALRDFTYDKSVLTFDGFTLNDELKNASLFPTADEDKGTISFGFMQSGVYSYTVGTINFTVNGDIVDATTTVGATAVAKNSSIMLTTTVNTATVDVKKQTLGDIDNNNTVDINDAIALFQYSIMPDIYPVEYIFRMDFNKDGNVDIEDAIMLFQYSIMPDIYPIEY